MTPPVLPPELLPERAPVPVAACPVCGGTYRALEVACETCQSPRGAPNVLAASDAAEQDALVQRVKALLDGIPASPRRDAVLGFGRAVLRSVAVVNVSASWAIQFFGSDKGLYTSYGRLVQAGARKRAAPEDDRARMMVEARLYGSQADHICYAALSLGCPGLTAYGEVSLQIRDVAVRTRASVLEENSYSFFERHALGTRAKADFPLGYRSPWSTRHLVAAAKLGIHLTDVSTEAEFGGLLLHAGATRHDDEFIEVHVYGTFDLRAVERVRFPARAGKQTSALELKLLKRSLRLHNIPVEEA